MVLQGSPVGLPVMSGHKPFPPDCAAFGHWVLALTLCFVCDSICAYGVGEVEVWGCGQCRDDQCCIQLFDGQKMLLEGHLRMFKALGETSLWTEKVSWETQGSVPGKSQLAKRKSLLFMVDVFYSQLLY